MENENKSISQKGIYLLPSLFTTAGLFAGFFGIIAAINGNFESAAVAVFIAMIMDALDGRIARMTNTQSAFGAEYDSLADMVSFGIAPAIIIFTWNLQSLNKLGWFAAFLYASTAALRLARFNSQLDTADKNYFQGLASPAAAAIVVGFIWAMIDMKINPDDVRWLSLIITTAAGLLMVSNIKYESFKGLDLKNKVPFIMIAAFVLIIAILSIEPGIILFVGFFIYSAYSPIKNLIIVLNKNK